MEKKLAVFLILFIVVELSYSTTIFGKFEHCTNDFCEILPQADLVKSVVKCTKLPIFQFFSKKLNKLISGVLSYSEKFSGKLITDPQEEISCEKKVENNFKDFTIIREGKTSEVVFQKLDQPSFDNIFDILNKNYFSKPTQIILKDVALLFTISFLFVIILIKVKKYFPNIWGFLVKFFFGLLLFFYRKLFLKTKKKISTQKLKKTHLN